MSNIEEYKKVFKNSLSLDGKVDIEKLKYQDVEEWSIYPLKTINLFEAIYVFLLVYGISFLSNKEKSKFATPIILSYMLFVAMTMALRIYLTSLIWVIWDSIKYYS